MQTLALDPPRLRYVHPLGALQPFRSDPLRFLLDAAQRKGGAVRFRLGPYTTFFFAEPEAVKHVLVDNNHNYDKQTRGWEMMRLLLGNGLLTSEGDFWRRQRRIAQPAFHRHRIAEFSRAMVELTEQMLERWDATARLGRTLDVFEEMNTLALHIVARTLLGTQVEALTTAVSEAVTAVNEYAKQASTGVFVMPLSVPTPTNRRVLRANETLHRVVADIVEQRRRSASSSDPEPTDLLAMLMSARDEETGATMSDQQLRDEVLTIFLAGHETTANALAWTFYLLSTHPAVAHTLDRELAETLGSRSPTLDDLSRLPYLERVLKESMRLYPPVWLMDRRARADDVVLGYRVPAGSLVMVSPYVTHRRADLWPKPEGFEPDRFTPELEKTRPRYAYFPFGGGPRLCIGNAFALVEARLVLATVLQRFRPWLIPGHPVRLAPYITLRPRYGLEMGLERVIRSADSRA